MTYSSDFVKTVALIAAKAQSRWKFLTPERSVEFAWFSVNEVGDASEVDADLVRHFKFYLSEVHGVELPEWMI